ncbi:hypothetical protein FQA39_LY09212 [Lamprigera yunnana]|nr:hypothetical protein FQA39_LY09212 [Lamprigera yunnana]
MSRHRIVNLDIGYLLDNFIIDDLGVLGLIEATVHVVTTLGSVNLEYFFWRVIGNVKEARAEISGPSEKYLKPGSGLRLQCRVIQSTEPPLYVFWYHNNRMINYDMDQGINVTTELPVKISTLTISNAATRHSGNYSCVPSNAQPASAYVHILNGSLEAKRFYTSSLNTLNTELSY